MSGLFSSLNATVKAISAHSRALETSGKNLANVNNTSYARQRVIFGDRGTVVTPTGAESLGIEALAVQQMRDSLLDRQVMREISISASFTAEQSGYQRAQAGLGQSVGVSSGIDASTAAGNGVGAAMDSMLNAFQNLAVSPTDIGARQAVLQKASILTDRFQLTDARLAQVQSDLSAQIGSDVEASNSILETIASLNSQIGRFEVNAPGSAVDLRDQRQAKLEELAAKLPLEITDIDGSQIQVRTRASDGSSVTLVDRASVTAEMAFSGTTVSAGGIDLAPSSGSIKGAITARDGAVQKLRENLSTLANQLVVSVNRAYNPSGTGSNFFDPAGTSAGTIALASDVTPSNLRAGDGSAAGDNKIALAVSAVASHAFSKTGTPPDLIDGKLGDFYSSSVSEIGQALSGVNTRADDQLNIQNLIRTQRDSVGGVSLDEEMADLMKFQRAFQASSRVFSVIDDLLENVVTSLGR